MDITTDYSRLKYFTNVDFNRCSPKCEITDMNLDFLKRLEIARFISGVPFILNSAYRSLKWERKKGRSGTSSHVKGLAVDIRCTNSMDRIKIVKGLIKVGFTRIGIHNAFIHVDADETKPNSIWLY